MKEEIYGQLKAGVPRAWVVQDLRDDFFGLPEEEAQPQHYASSGAIYKLSRGIGDQRVRKALDDYSSSKKWVADRPNDFFYSKFQHELDQNYPVRL